MAAEEEVELARMSDHLIDHSPRRDVLRLTDAVLTVPNEQPTVVPLLDDDERDRQSVVTVQFQTRVPDADHLLIQRLKMITIENQSMNG